ncbi:hypothetical protein [Heliophilum fasciatum]|uniref:hypothetical protein n=1 Tax=Heliophilum fasciatum TaxID=35700 RepID=UPI001046A5C2|nr:hypothetical protein [Heliophilum fasciatum]MCW2277273.1 hypothetical protein [Heliophilum fasciatum]
MAGEKEKSLNEQFSALMDRLNTDKELQKKVFIGGGLLLVVILAAVLLVNKPWAAAPEEAVPVDKQAARSLTYLPETQRSVDDTSLLRDPFSGAITLKGIIKGGDGNDVAIIENGKTSYVAALGAQVGNGWSVAEITANSVTLASDSQKIKLELNGRNKSEKITNSVDKKNDTKAAAGQATAPEKATIETAKDAAAKDTSVKSTSASGGNQ